MSNEDQVFKIFTGTINYHGPMHWYVWCLIHPFLTVIIALAFCEALKEIGKGIGKWGKHK